MNRKASFYLLASITVSLLASSSAPTPLYAIYQAQWGFSAASVTLIFGIYALAVLVALLFAGRLSDHVGRRPVLLAATAIQAVTMVYFAMAGSLGELLAARVIQGLATGAAVGAVGAGLLDLDKARGTIANAVSPPIGTASGAILAGAMVQYLPQPTHLVFFLLAVVFLAQFAGVLAMRETAAPVAGAWASLKPTLHVPLAARAPMMFAIPALVATWALAGFYASLGPAVVKGMLGTSSSLVGGLTLFVLAGSAAVAVLVLHSRDAQQLLRIGTAALLAGVAITFAGVGLHSAAGFFIGTAIAGVGFGAGFQGAVRAVVTKAAAHERAGVLSVAFVVSYLAMGLPAIIAGYFVTHNGALMPIARDFGAMVMVLAALAWYGARERGESKGPGREGGQRKKLIDMNQPI